ncbi:hypothetical protein ACFQJ5_02380 [Halomicroarcula sp. GCM10025324]|uniref:DUF7383 domain-containing protein n=1 Tax=Haloarcula TaxID=2237 RepID=UPI0023E8D038|nr:hypothetical protein [Halomicroarcula sp. ZS-22-S1]
MPHRANYARCTFQQHLGPTVDSLDVPWAEFTGDETDVRTFEVPTADPRDPYVEMQVFDVGDYGHEILVNGASLSGFDIATADRWQYWMDTLEADHLREGENTLQFRRNAAGDDAFVVGTAIVHWREPVA